MCLPERQIAGKEIILMSFNSSKWSENYYKILDARWQRDTHEILNCSSSCCMIPLHPPVRSEVGGTDVSLQRCN